jgi:hypothetical protein
MLGSSSIPWTIPEIIACLMMPYDVSDIPFAISNVYRPPYPNYPCYYLKIRILLMLIFGRSPYETYRGTSLTRILTFARWYGYQERWIRRALQELVRERFLECLEAPSEATYTKAYELSETHSFRPSPLAVELVERMVSEPVYLCIIGHDLPFHRSRAFENYKGAMEKVLGTLFQRQLDRSTVGLLTETDLARVVAQYLASSFAYEQPAENSLRNVPEIAATETQLKSIVERLSEFATVPTRQYISARQPPLFDLPDYSSGAEPFPTPENILDVRIGNSTYGPLIFWALVALRKKGKHYASGTEITLEMNKYLDDYNRKWPNNVSRALRSETLRSQKWLKPRSGRREGQKYFGLAEDWGRYWVEVFGEPAPDVD